MNRNLYKFRCTVARENAYTSADGPGVASKASTTRTPGSVASSDAEWKPPGGIAGNISPCGKAMT